jgi:hypothetical protein
VNVPAGTSTAEEMVVRGRFIELSFVQELANAHGAKALAPKTNVNKQA